MDQFFFVAVVGSVVIGFFLGVIDERHQRRYHFDHFRSEMEQLKGHVPKGESNA